MVDESWEFNYFYLPKGIAAKAAIEESAAALFASLFPHKTGPGPFGAEEINGEVNGPEGAVEENECLCAILFYDRSEKGTGFLPINIAYKDPEEIEGMLMEGCRSKYTDKFFKKLNDKVLSKILAKEVSAELPPKQRKRLGLNMKE